LAVNYAAIDSQLRAAQASISQHIQRTFPISFEPVGQTIGLNSAEILRRIVCTVQSDSDKEVIMTIPLTEVDP
jgi:hypothetical protein